MMCTKRLGNTDLEISSIGLGAWPFCSGYDWGNTQPPDVDSVLRATYEQGINWIDTAPIYEGSEILLGQALKGRRSQFLLATKCGLIKRNTWPEHDLSPQTITQQLENSLRALQTDYVDLYQIHYPDPKIPLAESLAVLFRLKEQGKIRAVGVCNVSAEQLNGLPQWPDCVQNEFSLLHPAKGKEVFSFCQEKGIAFVGYGSLCGGILSGKYTQVPNLRRADARNYFYRCYRGEDFTKAQLGVARVRQVAARLGQTPSAVALAWALSFSQVTAVLCGAKTAGQLTENARGARLLLTPEDLAFLESK